MQANLVNGNRKIRRRCDGSINYDFYQARAVRRRTLFHRLSLYGSNCRAQPTHIRSDSDEAHNKPCATLLSYPARPVAEKGLHAELRMPLDACGVAQ